MSQTEEHSIVFPSPFVLEENAFTTLVELRMRNLSQQIREKPRWWEKVNDKGIVDKWRQEIIEQDAAAVEKLWGGEEAFDHGYGKKHWPRERITPVQLNYIFDELKWLASQHDEETGIDATGIPCVYQSMGLVSSTLKGDLLSGASMLESVPPEKQDWHPGSNNQVLDLVHPSLYCYLLGRSLVKRQEGDGQEELVQRVLSAQEYFDERDDLNETSSFASEQHQWLPTDFDISSLGEAKPLSYINNLHPVRHQRLYIATISILSRFVPLWERVLTDVLSPKTLAIQVNPYEWYSSVPDFDWSTYRGPEDGKTYEEYENTKWPAVPDPASFSPPSADSKVAYSLKGKKLQVIVKMANIVLTPENPRYQGGSWHVEGMENERIVATGLYYYHSQNITESKLGFRTVVGDGTEEAIDIPYEQNDDKGYSVVYGVGGQGTALNQELGSIVTKEDKCLAFPNIYQHRVAPFELADPSVPGSRKILAFFLVDPTKKILSTSDVPPQQMEWTEGELAKLLVQHELPVELHDMIVNYWKEGLLTLDEAKEEREKLMAERANAVVEHNEQVFEIEFNMCEH